MTIQSIGNSGTSPPPATTTPGATTVAKAEVAATPAPPQQPTQQQVQEALESVRKTIDPVVSSSLQFSVDEETGKTVVSITDVKTGEMIRQIPSKELLEIAKSLDRLQGLFLKQQA